MSHEVVLLLLESSTTLGQTVNLLVDGAHGLLGGLGLVLLLGLGLGDHLLRQLAIGGQAGAGGNELADDDVLLQANEVVDLALDGGIGQHLFAAATKCDHYIFGLIIRLSQL